ncbi:hypothetical protein JKF63_00295 [Porcisia hertigi]|uniref:RING-type domain-containing protein n=1 Tax=Porcisia hertigi TaxID=2761500 RepID=A0A836KWY4_9TRYP|nr:hypothetical protein JKF63_00295 [Porcisia hertigi]
MYATVPILTLGPYSLAFLGGLLLYWNTSFILSRLLTAFIVSMIAMKLDLAFHAFFSCCHQVVTSICRLRTFWNPNESLNLLQTNSQLYAIADTAGLALLVGNTLQFWTAALVTRIALSALATRVELGMRWWQSQSAVEHALFAIGSVLCCTGCALQWAYYTLLPLEERAPGGTGSLLMWYTSIVYIVALGLRSACSLTTAMMRMGGYRVLGYLASRVNDATARALEDSGLNPFSEVHDLYMQYFYAVACAVTAWYYSSSSIPMWMQCFMLLRVYLITLASGKLRHYRQVLDRFPSVAADPTKTCGICLDDFVGGESVKSLPCGHTFHGACIRSWLIRTAVCPTCRQPVLQLGQNLPTTHSGRISQSSRVSLDMRVPADGGDFTGSLHPLAPRPQPSTPLDRPSNSYMTHSNSDPLPQTPPFPVDFQRLPHCEELRRIDAKRRSLALYRQRQLFPESTLAAEPLDELHEEETEDSMAEEGGGVDALLFTETPLLPANPTSSSKENGAASTRRKRQRPPPPEGNLGSATKDSNATSFELAERENQPSRRRVE